MNIDGEALYKAINNWEATAPVEYLLDMKAYKDYFLNECGIKIYPSMLGNKYEIVDAKKYIMFLLRWA